MTLLLCKRRGCGQKYDPASNPNDACTFHPGMPVFHEGLKSWSCCPSTKVLSFDEFLELTGCCVGAHSIEEVAQPQFLDTSKIGLPDEEVFGAEVASQLAGVNLSTPKPTKPIVVKTAPKAPEMDETKMADDPAVEVPTGTACRRRSCGHRLASAACRDLPCTFHPGTPVFHEGSKGWSCCSRKVLDFNDFLAIAGCRTVTGHRFLEHPLERAAANGGTPADAAQTVTDAAGNEYTPVDVRNDWYQTQTSVIVSFFAKNVIKSECSVEFGEEEIRLFLVMPDRKAFKATIPLFQPIDPAASKFFLGSVKVELTLAKANGVSWVSLQPMSTPIRAFTTFGTTGRVGTVGGKVIDAVHDAAILYTTTE
ncbi:hypothetical protein H696_01073 [Fonticula alba]|uniref:Uncharacterized protein n=1 Tax=Fonticula alba TaxID=691883 RepID=A0A058ZB80_FONAL|nr:hypothetical protein H696_01073 [Fonticula alba]KCV71654.1 hypothetical protein H696_01073 [Fonticula alba]|eukprot:XP_009493232.1 hypothetical protein H696_01073 [Fonticula alba]